MTKRADSYVENVPNLAAKDLFIAGVILMAAVVLMSLPASFYNNSITGPRASSKPFKTFSDFYAFYLSEHLDMTNRRLHFIGTTLVITVCLLRPALLQSVAFAAIAGYVSCTLFQGLKNGLAEGLVFLSTFLFCSYFNNCLQYAFIILLCGYGFAWVGHFNYELNKPATFIYPTYSLIGDVRMWFDCLIGAQPAVWYTIDKAAKTLTD